MLILNNKQIIGSKVKEITKWNSKENEIAKMRS